MKQADIKQLSTSDLRDKVKDEKDVLAKLKLNHSVSPIENPAKITLSRKNSSQITNRTSHKRNSGK